MPRSPRRCAIAKLHNVRRNRKTSCRGGRPCPPVGQSRVCRNVSQKRSCVMRVDATPAGQFRSATARSAALSAEDGHRPLQTWYGFALVHPYLRVCAAGRTEASAPTKHCTRSPMVRAGFCCLLHNPSVSFADSSLYTRESLGCTDSHRCTKICGVVPPGGASPSPTLRQNNHSSLLLLTSRARGRAGRVYA